MSELVNGVDLISLLPLRPWRQRCAALLPRTSEEVPEDHRRHTPIWPPGLRSSLGLLDRHRQRQRIQHLNSLPEAEIPACEDVGPADMEQQEHLRRPHAYPGKADEPPLDLFLELALDVVEQALVGGLGQ